MSRNIAIPDEYLRRLVAAIIRQSPKKRQQIAEELTKLLGQEVSTHMLNSWTAYGRKQARFPAAFVAAFCEVMNDDRLEYFLVRARARRWLRLGELAERILQESAKRLRAVERKGILL